MNRYETGRRSVETSSKRSPLRIESDNNWPVSRLRIRVLAIVAPPRAVGVENVTFTIMTGAPLWTKQTPFLKPLTSIIGRG